MASALNKVLLVWFVVCINEIWARCDAGWIWFSLSDSCYNISQNRKTWPDAKSDCEAMGSHLVTVMSLDENSFLKSELRRLNPDPEMQFWMDGTDSDTEGIWLWESTGDRFLVSDWRDGEPNQINGEEDCLTFNTRVHFKWNDARCFVPQGYICEKKSSNAVVG